MGELPPFVYALDFSSWKRPALRDFVAPSRVTFVADGSEVPPGGTLIVWGLREPQPRPKGIRIVHVEDGFLRSVGLGADLIRPLSWVLDEAGIYYDATRASDLEVLLQTQAFTPEDVARAARLREALVAAGLTKYNVGGPAWQRPALATRVILVPGQVESDASIRFGAPGERTNLGLLKAVRAANPDAHIVYKPHPDVVAGLRDPGKGEDQAAAFCDEQVVEATMADLIAQVDEVHVLTSLAGFEALLRGKVVACHGAPFYSGWGLTQDAIEIPRRTRRLALDELVAGVLIAYPRYVSRATGARITPERALEELVRWRAQAGTGVPLWRKLFRHVLRVVVPLR